MSGYSPRVARFREGVYASSVSYGCRLLLLRLADQMSARAIVSVPRAQLAEALDCDPSRITGWVNEAKKAGLLDTVRRGRPGVTAVYQGLVWCGNRTTSHGAVSLTRSVRKPHHLEVRKPPSQEVVESGTEVESPRSQRGSDEETEDRHADSELQVCDCHGFPDCASLDHPHTREESA